MLNNDLFAADTGSDPGEYTFIDVDEGGARQARLACEAAVALSCNGINQAVMMASPLDLDDFAVGFCVANGVVEDLDEIYDIQIRQLDTAWQVELQLSSRAIWQLKEQRRTLAGTSGCGLCGVSALEQAQPKLPLLPSRPPPPAAHLHGLRKRLAAHQRLARSSGALHAAAFVDGNGEIGLCREDIGRHNALDKLIGAMLRAKYPLNQGFALVTSRCSVELIHKALRAGLSTLVTLSAPTSLSVELARSHQLNLIHLPHESAPRLFSRGAGKEAL